MSTDDLTKKPADESNKTTQPMIADLFKLVEEVKQGMETGFAAVNARIDDTNARLDSINTRLDDTNARLDDTNARLDTTNSRLDEVESRLARDIEALNTRVVQGFRDLKYQIKVLNKDRLQTDAEYEELSDRVRELESKAS